MSATGPRRTPVQRRSIETVEAILEAAAQVFEREGYAAGTTNRIAERAGVSIGSLYQYFPNKDAVLVALTERHLQEGTAMLVPLLGALVDDPPPVHEAVDRVMHALLELHRHRPRLHRVLFEEAPRPGHLRHDLDAAANAATETVAEYLRRQPDVTVPDVHTAAQLVVSVAESTTHSLVIHPRKGIAPETYVQATVTMLTRYLTG